MQTNPAAACSREQQPGSGLCRHCTCCSSPDSRPAVACLMCEPRCRQLLPRGAPPAAVHSTRSQADSFLLQAAAAHQQREALTVQLQQREVQQAAANDERDRANSELSERSLQATQLEADLQTKTHEVMQLQAQLSGAHQVGGLEFVVGCLAGNNKGAGLCCMLQFWIQLFGSVSAARSCLCGVSSAAASTRSALHSHGRWPALLAPQVCVQPPAMSGGPLAAACMRQTLMLCAAMIHACDGLLAACTLPPPGSSLAWLI